MKVRLHLASLEGSFNVLVGLATAAGMAAVLLIGVRHVGTGVLTLGELLMVMAYMNQLYEPLKTISRKAATLQLHLASAERAFALLDEPSDVEERPNAQPLGRASGAIAFRNISFAYGKDRPVLHDISFNIEPGTRLGIAGASGAGKSTLISLLTRFYDPTEAAIVEAIRRLMRGRTVILITHRSRLLERCTTLVVLENGRLVRDTTRAAPMVVPVAGPAAGRERQSTLMRHPAVHAWRQLYPHDELRGITTLRIGRRRKVYRLQGAGP